MYTCDDEVTIPFFTLLMNTATETTALQSVFQAYLHLTKGR